jgi:hypothetical protein
MIVPALGIIQLKGGQHRLVGLGVSLVILLHEASGVLIFLLGVGDDDVCRSRAASVARQWPRTKSTSKQTDRSRLSKLQTHTNLLRLSMFRKHPTY